MKDTKITIIIPIFNTPEPILVTCFESIKKQTYSNFEVIVVDDGSNAECAAAIDSCVSALKNVTVLRKKNEGVSAARNDAMKVAQGEYITFVDADNYLPENALEIYAKAVSDTDIDLLIGISLLGTRKIVAGRDIIQLSGDKQSINSNSPAQLEHIFDKNELVDHLLTGRIQKYQLPWGYFGDGPCGKLYKASIAKTILYSVNLKWEEDTEWLLIYISKCISICLIRVPIYFNIDFNLSATRRYRLDFINEYVSIVQAERNLMLLFPESIEAFAYKFFTNVFFFARVYLFHADNKNSIRQKYTDFKKWCALPETKQKMHEAQNNITTCSIRASIYKLMIFLYNRRLYMLFFGVLKVYVLIKKIE